MTGHVTDLAVAVVAAAAAAAVVEEDEGTGGCLVLQFFLFFNQGAHTGPKKSYLKGVLVHYV